jgi:hypothetical protein
MSAVVRCQAVCMQSSWSACCLQCHSRTTVAGWFRRCGCWCEDGAEQPVPIHAFGPHIVPVCCHCCCAVQLTPLPRLSIDFSGHRQTHSSSSSSYARASSIRRSLDRCSMMPDDAASMFRSSSWELAEEQVSSSGLVGCASLQLQQQLPTLAVGETTESLGLGVLPSGLGFIEDVINETHLLQVRRAGRASLSAMAAACYSHQPHAATGCTCRQPFMAMSSYATARLHSHASQPCSPVCMLLLPALCTLAAASHLPGWRNHGGDLSTRCLGSARGRRPCWPPQQLLWQC